MWIDSHCHLDSLKCDSVDKALERARNRGVEAFICISTHLGNCGEIVSYSERYHDVWATVGVHPLDVKDCDINLRTLAQWTDHPKVVAIGETGLDYHYSGDTAALQRKMFSGHVELALETGLPLVVHTRNAKSDTLAILKEGCANGLKGVLHCFTEDLELAQFAIERGFFISFSGIITFKSADDLRTVARQLPLDRILIETDSPYLSPVPFRGKPNEPQFVVEVGEFLAGLLNLSIENFANQTTLNTKNLFSRML